MHLRRSLFGRGQEQVIQELQSRTGSEPQDARGLVWVPGLVCAQSQRASGDGLAVSTARPLQTWRRLGRRPGCPLQGRRYSHIARLPTCLPGLCYYRACYLVEEEAVRFNTAATYLCVCVRVCVFVCVCVSVSASASAFALSVCASVYVGGDDVNFARGRSFGIESEITF